MAPKLFISFSVTLSNFTLELIIIYLMPKRNYILEYSVGFLIQLKDPLWEQTLNDNCIKGFTRAVLPRRFEYVFFLYYIKPVSFVFGIQLR